MTNFSNLREFDISTINKDSKITIIKQNDFGYPISIQLKVSSIVFKDYAQYTGCLYIIGTPKGKRKQFGYLLKPNTEFSIFDGFVSVNDTTSTISSNSDVKVVSLGTCFDSSTLRAASDIKAPLLFSTIK